MSAPPLHLRNAALLVLIGAAAMSASATETDNDPIRAGHNLLRDDVHRPALEVGERVVSLSFRDAAGRTIYLQERLRDGPIAFVFLSTTCPLSKRYATRLKQLDDRYSSQGVSLVSVFSNDDESPQGVREYGQNAGFRFAVVRDVNGYLARRLGASMTPQALVVDKSSTLVYRGAIDDHRYENRVRHSYLASALEATLLGKAVARASVQALGCSVHLPEPPGAGKVAYTTHVARILQDNCQSCHRPGQVGPFALTSYEEAYRWRKEIRLSCCLSGCRMPASAGKRRGSRVVRAFETVDALHAGPARGRSMAAGPPSLPSL